MSSTPTSFAATVGLLILAVLSGFSALILCLAAILFKLLYVPAFIAAVICVVATYRLLKRSK